MLDETNILFLHINKFLLVFYNEWFHPLWSKNLMRAAKMFMTQLCFLFSDLTMTESSLGLKMKVIIISGKHTCILVAYISFSKFIWQLMQGVTRTK